MRCAPLLPLLLAAAPASASIARGLSVEEMAARADLVVLGTVTSQTAHWARNHEQIYTRVEIRIDERWVDRVGAGGTVTVLRPGGELDGLGQQALGEPQFAVGERAVLFLEKRGHLYRVVGLAQGLFRVQGTTAIQELPNLALARPDAHGQLAIGEHGEGAQPPLPLAALKRRVLAVAPSGGASAAPR